MLSVFLFNQKTAYEMRISDWSSDVCSSDLPGRGLRASNPRGGGLHPPPTGEESRPRRESRPRARRPCGGPSASPTPARPQPASSLCRDRLRRGTAPPPAAGCPARQGRWEAPDRRQAALRHPRPHQDRKSVLEGKRWSYTVNLSGPPVIKQTTSDK